MRNSNDRSKISPYINRTWRAVALYFKLTIGIAVIKKKMGLLAWPSLDLAPYHVPLDKAQILLLAVSIQLHPSRHDRKSHTIACFGVSWTNYYFFCQECSCLFHQILNYYLYCWSCLGVCMVCRRGQWTL